MLTNLKDARGAQGAQHRPRSPPGQRRGLHPGPQREQRGEQRGPDPAEERGHERRRDPGLFDVPGDDGDDEDDAHSRVLNDYVSINAMNH